MKTSITSLAAALCLTSGAAMAQQPTLMSDAQMDAQVAGLTVETRNGNIVWTVDSLDPPAGSNNGGYDSTASASGGLVNAVMKGGLTLGN